jgi:hypothetical protein
VSEQAAQSEAAEHVSEVSKAGDDDEGIGALI